MSRPDGGGILCRSPGCGMRNNKRKRTRPPAGSTTRRSVTASTSTRIKTPPRSVHGLVRSAAVISGLILGDSGCGGIGRGLLAVAEPGANPFASGCLRAKLGAEWRVRVCNSDDANNNSTSSQSHCSVPEFSYPEIRIAPGNWESSIFQAYITQIVLSEILGVPATLESGSRDVRLSFYDEANAFPYPSRAYGYGDLRTANEAPGGDCTYVLNHDAEATCAHVLPEVWAGQKAAWTEARKEGYTEPPEGTVTVGKLSWYLPRFVVAQDPSLATYLGLQGEENRRRLAETFLRPTTWMDYCEEVSETNCAVPDEVAQRPPTPTEIEEGISSKYRLEGVYTGYFRKTPQNDCISNSNCTGHIVDAPCSWSTNIAQQLYWNDIHLESNGPLQPTSAYSYGDMLDIWEASVETGSPVMMWWWYPDATVQKYEGTSGEFHPIVLPDPTEECRDARIGSDERCSEDIWVRRGNEEGKCDEEAHSLKRLIATSLGEETYKVAAAERSPGYQTVKNIAIDNLNLETMLGEWSKNGDAREAVCGWVAANIDKVMDFVPRGHPRKLVVNDWYGKESGLLYAAMAVGGIAIVSVVLSSWIVYRHRAKRIIRNSQVDFLFLVLFGCLLVGVAGLIYTLEPGKGTCTAKQFLIMIGFTLMMVPLLVKIEAILWIQRAGKKMKRVKLRRRQLYELVAIFVVLVLSYLIAWAVVDPPKRKEFLTLPDETGTRVEKSVQCSSDSAVWKLVEYLWEFLLIIAATLLAYQARHVRQEFNESELLYRLCYVQFFLLVLRAIIFFLQQAGYIAPTVEAGVTALFLSFSSISTLGLYFGPKFYLLKHGDDAAKRTVSRLGSNVSCWESVHAPTGLGGRRSSNFSDYSAAPRSSVYSSTEEQEESNATVGVGGGAPNDNGSVAAATSTRHHSTSHSSHRRKQSSLVRLQEQWSRTYDRASSRNKTPRRKLVTTQGVSQRMIDAFLGEGSQRAVVEKNENTCTDKQVVEPIPEKVEEEEKKNVVCNDGNDNVSNDDNVSNGSRTKE